MLHHFDRAVYSIIEKCLQHIFQVETKMYFIM